MEDTLEIKREQLAAFIERDEDAIRQFEKLFEFAKETIEAGIADATLITEAKANKAINEIFELKKSLTVTLAAMNVIIQLNTDAISENKAAIAALDIRVTALEP